jgi:Ca2+-binding EF-hand superfamily protein
MDQRGDHKLDVDDFRWGLLDFGIQVTKEEAQELLNRFDADKNGTVNFDEFMSAIKGGDLTQSRLALIRKAYEKLDVNHDG